MPYITREDGEHFVIPSYRDVLSAKQKSLLKKDILLLSQSYGEYITLQRKSADQYEVAFSPDTGYLLGESIWHYFKKPLDMIYCEAIPNTTEAILVIVKNGSVYLDGSFPLDSIPEELVIFLTQQNNFEIFTYGDVPISQIPEEGKFSFEDSSVKSFTVLDEPIFPTLPLLRIYQLQLVDQVLKAHGIGVFPTRQVILALVAAGLAWMLFSYIMTPKQVVEVVTAPTTNPYQGYYDALVSPAPEVEIEQFLADLRLIFTIPGWAPVSIQYAKGGVVIAMKSSGSSTEDLFNWAKKLGGTINIRPDGIYVTFSHQLPNRYRPAQIYPIKEVIGVFVDKLAAVYPGNHMKLDDFANKGKFTTVPMTITVTNATPVVVSLIGQQCKDLPFVLQSINMKVNNGNLTGTIQIQALGS